jgi:hypothetical protein
MRRPLLAVLFFALTACATTAPDPEATAPPDTITRYPSTAPEAPPSVVARENGATVTAAVPTDADVPGYTRADPAGVLMLCPTAPQQVPASIVHATGTWSAPERGLTVTAVLDPQNAPADTLLARLMPQDCPDRKDTKHYVYDRQPYERSDGWTGVLNTILATDTATGAQSYTSVYLLSKGDALVNVIADRANRATYDPSVDEVAAHFMELVLDRFAA